MKKLSGAAMAAALTAFPALAMGQTTDACTNARNFGSNLSEVSVGQVLATVNCDAKQLPAAELALALAIQDLSAGWTGSEEQKFCYFQGIYTRAIDRLQRDYARCAPDPAFKAPSLQTVAQIAIGTLSSMYDARLLHIENLSNVQAVFQIDYGFLGDMDAAVCRQQIKAVAPEFFHKFSKEVTPPRMYEWFLNRLENEICVRPQGP
jgi:hypothetical protein